MRIINVEKANTYYGNLNDVNESNIRKMKLYSIASIGSTLLLSTLSAINARNIGAENFSQIATSVLLPLLTTYTGIHLNASVNKMTESEKNIKKNHELTYLISHGTEEEQRAFLEANYPGLYDSIVYNHDNSKGMNR